MKLLLIAENTSVVVVKLDTKGCTFGMTFCEKPLESERKQFTAEWSKVDLLGGWPGDKYAAISAFLAKFLPAAAAVNGMLFIE